jgi:hypothetical protein
VHYSASTREWRHINQKGGEDDAEQQMLDANKRGTDEYFMQRVILENGRLINMERTRASTSYYPLLAKKTREVALFRLD